MFKKRQKKVALSLRGGGSKCISYLGALQALEEEGINVDIFLGSSGGALLAACYAAGKTYQEIFDIHTKFSVKDFMGLDSIFEKSILSDDSTKKVFDNIFGDLRIEDCTKRLFMQVTDVEDRKSVVFDQGNISQVLTACIAIPILYHPIEIDGKKYIDGDISSTFAADFLRANGAEYVIGLQANVADVKHTDSLINSIYDLMIAQQLYVDLDLKINPVDLLINNIGLNTKNIYDVSKATQHIELGYMQMKDKLKTHKDEMFTRW